MKKIALLLISTALLGACNTSKSTKDVVLSDSADSTSYAVGNTIGLNLTTDFESKGVDSILNRELILAGLADALGLGSGEPRFDKKASQDVITKFFTVLGKEKAKKSLADGEAFLNENKTKEGVVTTASGLQYIVLKEGDGATPTLDDQVVVHYTGTLLNGKVFDSSEQRNEPVTFYVKSVIPGWTEALQLMKAGANYKLFIPSALAYGEQGGPGGGIGPNETLIFDVKLIDVIKKK